MALFMLMFYLLNFANAQGNVWITPPPSGSGGEFSNNSVYAVGSTITLEWRTVWELVSISLWPYNRGTAHIILLKVAPPAQWTWDVQLATYGLEGENVFFFEVINCNDSAHDFNSHYFNITPAEATTTSTAVSPVSNYTAGPTTSSSSVVSANSDSGTRNARETDLAVGLGVGLGVGCLVVGFGAGLILLWLRRKRHVGSTKVQQAAGGTGDAEKDSAQDGNDIQSPPDHRLYCHELEVSRSELPAGDERKVEADQSMYS